MIRRCTEEIPVRPDRLRVEIPAECLLALLEERHVAAVNLRCLDAESRSCLKRLLLRACARNCAHPCE